MATSNHALSAAEVESLVRRYLDGEPGLVTRPLRRGHAFMCRAPFAAETATPWLFAVAADGGVLLRLPADARQRAIDNGIGAENVALPDWVLAVAEGASEADRRHVHGAPGEWLWVPIPDGAAFERRRPHIHEALEYCVHTKSQNGS